MSNIVQVSAKYLIILLFAVFTFVSFRAQQDIPEEKKRSRYDAQTVLLLMVHALAFICIGLNVYEGKLEGMTLGRVGMLYLGQLVYLIVMSIVLKNIIRISPGLINVICMFLVISFFVQTRLSFSSGVREFIYLLISTCVFVMALCVFRFVKFMHKLTWIYCIAGIILILIVLVFAQVTGGAQIQIDLGVITFQPFEFVKILFVLFVAGAFNKANSFKTVLITAIFAGAHVLLMVYCTELGTSLLLFVVYVLMIYVATKKFIYVLIGGAGFAAACVLAYKLFAHVQTRVAVWINPWTDMEGRGYQITQSLFAIGSGGWFGTGIAKGSPTYIPKVQNDFVFSAIAEEMGIVFSIFLILLCLCMTLMIFRVAIRLYKPFYKLTAFGLGSVYAFQVFLAIGGVIKFIPSTGINLPFVSSGGSSLISSMIMMGIVQALYIISEADVARERELVAERLALGEGLVDFEKNIEKDIKAQPVRSKTSERIRKLERRAARIEDIDPNSIV